MENIDDTIEAKKQEIMRLTSKFEGSERIQCLDSMRFMLQCGLNGIDKALETISEYSPPVRIIFREAYNIGASFNNEDRPYVQEKLLKLIDEEITAYTKRTTRDQNFPTHKSDMKTDNCRKLSNPFGVLRDEYENMM
ncbi:MAG: hypothetical protein WC916_03320 [Candidatus Woesearchaeota archaeon]